MNAKTVDTWTMSPEEILIKHGYKPVQLLDRIGQTFVMPYRRPSKSQGQRQDTPETGQDRQEEE